MKKQRNKKKSKRSQKSEENDTEVKEYGVVLTKEKKYRHRIYPQKGKVPMMMKIIKLSKFFETISFVPSS